jgi:hypothetical protein
MNNEKLEKFQNLLNENTDKKEIFEKYEKLKVNYHKLDKLKQDFEEKTKILELKAKETERKLKE